MEEKSNLDKIRSSMKFDRTNFVPNSAIELNRGYLRRPTWNAAFLKSSWYNPTMPQFKFLLDHDGSPAASAICSKHAIPIRSDGLRTWVNRQKQYIENLHPAEISIIKSYSKFGDRLINNYLRGTLQDCKDLILLMIRESSTPVLSYLLLIKLEDYRTLLPVPTHDEFMKEFKVEDSMELLMAEDEDAVDFEIDKQQDEYYVRELTRFIRKNIEFFRQPSNLGPLIDFFKSELIRLISSAPRLENPVTVYRGFKSEEHMEGLAFSNMDFISTSLDLDAAIGFSLVRTRSSVPQIWGGVYELKIHPSTACIYMETNTCYRGEFEILIMPGMNFKLDSKIYFKIRGLHSYEPHFKSNLKFKNTNVLANTGTEDKVAIVHGDVSAIPFDPPVAGGRRKTRKRSKKLKARR